MRVVILLLSKYVNWRKPAFQRHVFGEGQVILDLPGDLERFEVLQAAFRLTPPQGQESSGFGAALALLPQLEHIVFTSLSIKIVMV